MITLAKGVSTSVAALSIPWWSPLVEALTGINQFLVTTLGLVVLILTTLKLIRENRLLSAKLKGTPEGE